MKKILPLLLITLVLFSCKKDDDKDNGTLAGLGNTPGTPTGTAFNLPSDISVEEEIRGGEYFGKKKIDKHVDRPAKKTSDDWDYFGSGTYVDLYIKFKNNSSESITFTVPGGLIFNEETATDDFIGVYQKGLILQDVTITIEGGQTLNAVLYAYCLNEWLDGSDSDAIYDFGPVTNNPELSEIVSILKTKAEPDFWYADQIQETVWNVTDRGQSLTSAERDYLNALP